MFYTTTQIDRTTGNLITVTPNDWVTIRELSRLRRVGIPKLQAILHYLVILEDDKGNYRLTRNAISEGLGKCIALPNGSRGSLDLISPLGQEVVAENWDWAVAQLERQRKARLLLIQAGKALKQFKDRSDGSLNPDQEVSWLIRHLTQLKLEQLAILFQDADGCAEWTRILNGSSAPQ